MSLPMQIPMAGAQIQWRVGVDALILVVQDQVTILFSI
jgi:hypothetical protein